MRLLDQKSIQNVLVSLTLLAFLSACSKTIDTYKTEVPRTSLNLEEPAPVRLNPIEWIIITPENQQAIFDSLKSNGGDAVLFGLTDNDYKRLSLNWSQVRAFIVKQKNIIGTYKEYYENDGTTSPRGPGA